MATKQITGTFGIKSWDEKTWEGKDWKEVPGAKMTDATVVHTFHGVIEGEGTQHGITTYAADGTATYLGYERVIGSIEGRFGSFVMEHRGGFDGKLAKSTYTVVAGSGTGDLVGLRGAGGYTAGHQDTIAMTLDYYFE
jgi:hypothetical protein